MIWLSVKETAVLLRYSERAIRTKATNGELKYHYISSSTGQGGRKIEILLESLPKFAQDAYNNKNGNIQVTVMNEDYWATTAQRKKGELRARAVYEYGIYEEKELKKGGIKKTDIMKAFLSKWNFEHTDFQRTPKSLYEWKKKQREVKSKN